MLKINKGGFKVLTPEGYQPFYGVKLMGESSTIKLFFEHNYWAECTPDHEWYINNYEKIAANDLKIGDTVCSLSGDIQIIDKIIQHNISKVYDLIEVDNGHRFYANGILSSNCKFVTFEETLINPMLLATMDGRSPVNTVKNVRWYKELSTDMTYVVSLDPSLGTGGDNAAIEIFELPSMEQVGEWQHNLTPIDSQIKLLREILIYISDTTDNSSIYWSIENNSLGEAGLICIRETGEEKFPGVLLSEPKKKGVFTKQRKGFTTTNKSKLAAAARLKYLIESGKMNINSKPLISELKNYIASGAGFAAKAGKTDDLISAVLVIIRMTEILAGWDISISNAFTSDDSEEEIDEYDYPMPIFAHFS